MLRSVAFTASKQAQKHAVVSCLLRAPRRPQSSTSSALSEADEELSSAYTAEFFNLHKTSFTPSVASMSNSKPMSSWVQVDDGNLDLSESVVTNHRQMEAVKWNIPEYTIDERASLLMAVKPLLEPSASLEEAQRKSRAFYRLIVRRIPALLQWYNMTELHPMKAARQIRQHFEKYQGVTDVSVLDKLRWHGEVVLSDVVRNHFTYSHTFNLLNLKGELVPPPPKDVDGVQTDFLSDFFNGPKQQNKF